ncbi:signal recognition particle 14 kDa subunit [Tieghemostelium lacteum]|uniref:Signal recognition particle 14 kDa protein n=1 Tax=Tieghemostelium lacteum TaxID=361077 RepID=A0A151Z8D8_TIELA|nr:signal recognition particle 14 kDa subunit [Tieghemostelium lacteum]|eukprot:KYQ90220.1 signal recognition particle 14 kDa subunit [Tieghemostelium lacteum]
MVLLDNDSFLNSLNKLYTTHKTKGSVWVTMKRFVESDDNPKHKKGEKVEKTDDEEPKCLIRATDGRKKISTIVPQKDVQLFQSSYKNIILSHYDNLKKIQKTPKVEQKKKPAARKAN